MMEYDDAGADPGIQVLLFVNILFISPLNVHMQNMGRCCNNRWKLCLLHQRA